MIKTKKCSKCHEVKSLDEFHNDKNRKDGRKADCKECRIKEGKKYRREHREEKKKYNKNYRQDHPEEEKEYHVEYYQEHKERIKKREIEKRGCHTMYKNKLCAQYLGIVIGERLCRHLFKDVEVMPMHNPGFDIVCNRGKKIDVKTACTTLTPSKNPRWQFHIDHNIIPDYFICVTFDNRNDLNPLHLWMIPGKEVNNQSKASVSPPTLRKWNKWKRDINDAQLCCTELKNEKIKKSNE